MVRPHPKIQSTDPSTSLGKGNKRDDENLNTCVCALAVREDFSKSWNLGDGEMIQVAEVLGLQM